MLLSWNFLSQAQLLMKCAATFQALWIGAREWALWAEQRPLGKFKASPTNAGQRDKLTCTTKDWEVWRWETS